MDAILSILKSLGYEKTLDEDQVQVKESVDAVRALWVSLDLFLVQLDLQIIKEIMDNFTDSKLSLRHFIKARARTCNVKDACQVLSGAATKRAKTEKVQDSETSSQRQLTPTKIGDMNTTEDVIQVPAYAVSGADSESKNSDLSAATETTAMDTDETTEGITSVSSSDAYTRSRVDPLHGYVPSSKHPAPFMGVNINDRDLYGAHAEENQLERKQERFVTPHGTSVRTRHLSKIDTKRMVDTSELTSQSLPYLGTTTSPLLSTRISTDTHIAYTDTSTRTGRQVQGSKYVGLPDIRGSASHQVASNASFQSYRPKENASQHKNSTAVEDRRQLSATEPMEVETQESRANRVENFGSYSSKMAEGGYARPEAQPGVSEYSHRSSRLNEFTGGAYALFKAHPGFSDLDRNRLQHLNLENGTSKRAAVQSSSAKEATSKAPSGVSDSSRAHSLSSRSNEFTEGAYAGAEGQPAVSEYGRRSSRSNEFTGGAYAGAEGQPGVSEYSHRSSRSNEFTGGAYAGAEAQPGVSEYSHRSSRSKEFTGGAYAGAEAQPGVSEYSHRSSRSKEFTGGAYAGAEGQPGVSEYSHRSSRSKEFTGGAYAGAEAQPGVSEYSHRSSRSKEFTGGAYAGAEAQPGVSEYSHRSSRSKEFTGGAYAGAEGQPAVSEYSHRSSRSNEFTGGAYAGAEAQPGVSEYSHRSSRSKEFTGGAYAGAERQPGVSEYSHRSSRSKEFTGGAYAGAEGQPAVSEYSHRSSRSNEFTGGAYAGAEAQPGVSEYSHRSSRSKEFTGGAYTGAEGQPGVSEYSHRSCRSKEFTGGAYTGAEGQPAVSEYSHRSSRSKEFTGGAYSGAEAQPGVSEYSHRSSRLNEFTGGAYALSKAHPGFSDLDRNQIHHLTLENGTSKRAAVQSSSAKEATSHGTGTTRVEYVPDDVVVSQSNCSPLPNVGAGYGYSLYKKEGNGSSDHVRHNTRSAARFLQDQGKSDEKFQESRLKRDYYSERSGKDPVPEAEATSLRKDEELKGATSKVDPKHAASVCGHCLKQGELMCRNCLLIVCKECDREIYSTELCGVTKDRHVFSELKSANSLDTSCSSPVYEGKEWSCSRCTFLNQLEHKICVICGATRGVGDVEQLKPGSIVCTFCTFHNEQDATVCKACSKTLDKSESFV